MSVGMQGGPLATEGSPGAPAFIRWQSCADARGTETKIAPGLLAWEGSATHGSHPRGDGLLCSMRRTTRY